MDLQYGFKASQVEISEEDQADEKVIWVQLLDDRLVKEMHQIRRLFEDDDEVADVIFYTFPNHKYKILVKEDFYNKVLIQLFAHQVLTKLKWKS